MKTRHTNKASKRKRETYETREAREELDGWAGERARTRHRNAVRAYYRADRRNTRRSLQVFTLDTF